MSLDPNRSWIRGYSVLGVPVVGSQCTEWTSTSDLVLSKDRMIDILQREDDYDRSRAVIHAINAIDLVDKLIIDLTVSNLDL